MPNNNVTFNNHHVHLFVFMIFKASLNSQYNENCIFISEKF